MDIKEWIKANAREGVDIEEGIKLLDDLNPLKNITNIDAASAFIERNPIFKDALNRETTSRIENHDKRFREEKLPGILKEERDRVTQELNPDETPEQKRIRELEENLQQRDSREAQRAREDSLRTVAADLGTFPIQVEQYAAFGDQAEEFLRRDAKLIQETIDTEVSKQLKARYGGNPPPGNNQGNPEKTRTRAQYFALSPQQQSTFVSDGGTVVDE
jgi:cell fate (sporulation/competence/biofilm development) regulator YmcA (YheA/YmcA/DUF963 family)